MIDPLQPTMPKTTRWHSVMGFASLAVTCGTGALLAWLFPPLRITLLDVVFGDDPSGPSGAIAAIIGIVMMLLIVGLLLRPSALNEAAMSEEVKYRAGAEEWSAARRVWMVARFGVAHLFNLIVPVTIIIGLALSGVLMMWVYLDAFRRLDLAPHPFRRNLALGESAAVHAAHNRWALRAIPVYIAVVTVANIL